MPCILSTLLCIFNDRDELLLLHRHQEPNLGKWSPLGGKIDLEEGESPHMNACREAREEAGLELTPNDIHLLGVITETNLQSSLHWMMFLFEALPKITSLPEKNREGEFEFIAPSALDGLPLPDTDREMIWPLFWRHRGGFFAARCCIDASGVRHWTVEESSPSSTTSSHG